jgi:hypothetical protein
VPIVISPKRAKKRSFLIEILSAGREAAKALTICGRGLMTLSGRYSFGAGECLEKLETS